LSTPAELEQLQRTRTQLEEEHRSLEEEQKTLELRTKMLEEKITIQELKRDNKSNRESIGQLKTKMSELEHKLEGLSDEPSSSTSTFEPRPESTQPIETVIPEESTPITETPPTSSETHTEASEQAEESVQVSVLEDTTTPKQEEVEVFRQHEKKKRRLF
jgi:peptidoglycan hydrolase CwlO-like protein